MKKVEINETYLIDLGASVPTSITVLEIKKESIIAQYNNSWANRKEELSLKLLEFNGLTI